MTDPDSQHPIQPVVDRRALTAAEFQGLADVPPEFEWLAPCVST